MPVLVLDRKLSIDMTTAEVAGRLIKLCKEGEFIQAQKELYDADIIRIEVDGTRTTGATNMHVKEQQFLDSLDKIHSIGFSEPLIVGDFFTVVLKLEIDIKNIGYKAVEEICVYQIANGKIVFEQFFRDVRKAM